MKKSILILIVSIIGFKLSAQDTLSYGRALNFPFRKYGISIGNSHEFNGIRLNFAEHDVKKINGLNITFWSRFRFIYNPDEIVNGISAGVIPTAMKMQGINFFLLGAVASKELNGFSFGGFGVGAEKINGVSVSGIFQEGGKINGLSLSGFLSFSDDSFNGLAITGIASLTTGDINGVVCSTAGIYSEGIIRGMAATAGYLKAGSTEGLSLAGYAYINQVHGLSIALLNRTHELHGIQLGILNFAGNNRKGLKLLPLINLHF